MKALVVNAIGGGFDFEDVDIAAPLGREVLVEVRASGLCHTDLLFAANPIFPTPAVFGHEISGIVAEIGPEVTQFRAGDHVVGSLAQSCGSCPDASRAAPSIVNTRKRPSDGRAMRRGSAATEQPLYQGLGLAGFAERALIHENQLALVPMEMPFAQGALLGCGVVTGAGAVLNTASVVAGDTVVIFGAGGVDSTQSAALASPARRGSWSSTFSPSGSKWPESSVRPTLSTLPRQNLSKPSATFCAEAPIMCSISSD